MAPGRRPRGSRSCITLLTAGVWAVVWLAIVFSRRDDRVLLEVDDRGDVWARVVASA